MTTQASPPHTNRLAQETSPYLLQHAHNPVDWYPWGPDALTKARDENRPIFLSIGYAACHWCHVMERESFEDEETAAFLNQHFVSIKVDREERPDLDAIYMDAVQAMTGGGGWPMTVFLLPDGRPFYGGTYFPDRPVHGMPSFRQVLEGVLTAYRDQRSEVEAAAAQLTAAIDASRRRPAAQAAAAPAAATRLVGPDGRPLGSPRPHVPPLDRTAADTALAALERTFDARHGGWGGAPKFPAPMTIDWLLRIHATRGDRRALAMARRTLDAMADGGIHDQLGGGFARYATDQAWLVPHFEKMLYDNAQLARVYVRAWQATGDERYGDVARDTLDWMLRELRLGDGTLASSLDADTNGEEGATYVWTAEEIQSVLGEDAALFAAAYGVTPGGNWEGRTILSRVTDNASLAGRFGLPVADVDKRLRDARTRLLEVRAARPQPARDDKALAAWNGLAIGALADAAAAFREPRYRDAAVAAAEALVAGLRTPDGRLRRSWKDGRALHGGVLEDYADLADGLLALYGASWDARWFRMARELIDVVLARFADPNGGFFDTPDDGEALVARPKGVQDGAVPSGGAMAATVLLRVGAMTGESRYREAAETAIRDVALLVARYPAAFAQWLIAHDLATARIDEVAIVGGRDEPATDALVEAATSGFQPHRVVAVGEGAEAGAAVPLLRDRPRVDGQPAAYVCHGFACLRPVTTPEDLLAQLAPAT